MAVSDFLVNGNIPAGSAVTSTTGQTTLPDWYTNQAMQLLSNQNAVMNKPYQPAPMPAVAGFTPTGLAGQDMTKTAATAYQPGLNAATGTVNAAAAAPGALTAAQPYFDTAAGTSASHVGEYMSPYTTDVVNRIAELGSRNLSENLMPAIEGRYIGAGQLGGATRGGGLSGAPSGMLTDTARAVRDTNSDILGQQATALNNGYQGALSAASGDLSRIGNIGANVANASNTQLMGGLAAGNAQAGLATDAQTLGLTGANAVTGVGNAEMAKNQQNLDAARADWMRQQGYPQAQIDAALNTFKGVFPGVPTTTSSEGIVPNSVPTTSTGQNMGSALTGLGGLIAAYKGI